MKKSIFYLLIILLASPAYTQKAQFGESEVRGVKKVKFINKSTRRAADAIRDENTATGKSLSEKMTGEATETSAGSIQVRRFPSKGDKLGGDVFILSEKASFGHINSIVRILSSYIQNSFQYEEEDSDVLALYTLYYNAIHRGDTAYISEKYTEELFGSLDPDKTGIDESYKNWAGKTQIVIPIERNVLKEDGKDVKTKELGEEVGKVIDTKKNGPETKKKFEDMQTRKTDQEKKDIVTKEKEVLRKEEQLNKQEKKAVQEVAELKKNPEKNKEQIKQKEAEIKQIDTAKKKVAEVKQAVAEKKKDLTEDTKFKKTSGNEPPKAKEPVKPVEELKKELVAAKQELAEKKAEEKKKELYDENVVGGKILFLKTLKYLDKGHYNNELQMLDPVKDDMVFRGEYNNICSNTFEVFGDKVVVIGYGSNHSAKHNLVLIDQATLKKTGESETGVFWRTPMIVKGDELYAFEEDGESYYLTRFDKTLKKTGRSAVDVSPDSNVTFYGTKIYLTGKQKDTGKIDIVVLKKDDLGFIKRIQP